MDSNLEPKKRLQAGLAKRNIKPLHWKALGGIETHESESIKRIRQRRSICRVTCPPSLLESRQGMLRGSNRRRSHFVAVQSSFFWCKFPLCGSLFYESHNNWTASMYYSIRHSTLCLRFRCTYRDHRCTPFFR